MNYFVKTNKIPAQGRNEAFKYSAASVSSASGGVSPSGGVSAYSQLSDVALTNLAIGQIAYFNGEKWVNNSIITIDNDHVFIKNTTNSAGIYVTNNEGVALSSLNYNATVNKWFAGSTQIMTGGDILGALLTDYVVGTDIAISSDNSILTAFERTQGQINNRTRYNAQETIQNRWFFSDGLTSNGQLIVNNILAANKIGIIKTNSSDPSGISLWGTDGYDKTVNNIPNFGLFFGYCPTFGGFGGVTDYATYFTSTGGYNRGWIYKNNDSQNVASIDGYGRLVTKDNITAGSGASMSILRNDGSIELYGGTPFIDFHFANNGGDYTSRIIESMSGTIDFHANTRFSGYLSNTGVFSSGFAGSGWALVNNSGGYELTVDNLNVRKSMNIYELVVNQIRATNGSLWVSDAMRCKADGIAGGGGSYYVEIDADSTVQPFVINDIIKCQKFTGRNIKYYVARVTVVSSIGIWMQIIEGSGIPQKGDDLVRIGSTSDTNRQGSIYLTSADSGAPYIDVIDGVTSGSFEGKTKVRLGKLSGIIDSSYGQLSGYGLYSDNVFLTGKIVAKGGKIGNFQIDENWLKSGNQSYINGNWGGGAIGVSIGKDANQTYTGVYNDWDNGSVFGGLSVGLIHRHGVGFDNKLGFNFFHNNNTLFEISREITTGEITAKISGFNFTESQLYSGSLWGWGAGVGLYNAGAYSMLHAYKDTSNYVRVGYGIDGGTAWGINGVVNSQSVFSLGTTNKIAGFTFDNQSIQSEGIQLYSSPSSPYINFKQTTDGSWTQSGLFFSTQVYENVASMGINVLANNTSPYVRWRNDGNYIEIRHTTDTRDDNTRIYMQGKVKMFNQLQLSDSLLLSYQRVNVSTSTYSLSANIQWNVINLRSYYNGTSVVGLPSTHSYGFRLTIVIDKANQYGITLGNFYNNNGDSTTISMAKGDIIELMWVGYWQLINSRV